MKKIFFTIFCFALWSNSYGQKTEFSIAFNSGLFSFAGQSAEKETFINYNSVKNSSYTNNPYGAENSLSPSAELTHESEHADLAAISISHLNKVITPDVIGVRGPQTYASHYH